MKKTMKKIDKIREAADRALNERLANVDAEVNTLVGEFMRTYAKKIVLSAFGLRERHFGEVERDTVSKYDPLMLKIQSEAAEAAKDLLPQIREVAIGASKSRKSSAKMRAALSRMYRDEYESAFESEIMKLVEDDARERGEEAAGKAWTEMLEAELGIESEDGGK